MVLLGLSMFNQMLTSEITIGKHFTHVLSKYLLTFRAFMRGKMN